MHLLGRCRHWSLGIEIGVVAFTGYHPADHFDASYLYHPIPSMGIKAGRFGIENYLSHSTFECEPVLKVMQDPLAAF